MNEQKSLLWVGISMQKGSNIPLDEKFASGELIKRAIDELSGYVHHRTNLVNFAPLDSNEKLRYPSKQEIRESFEYLLRQIEELCPQIIVALGGIVTKSLSEMLDMPIKSPKIFECFITEGDPLVMSAYHPSYVSTHKRKNTDEYIKGIVDGVNNGMSNNM